MKCSRKKSQLNSYLKAGQEYHSRVSNLKGANGSYINLSFLNYVEQDFLKTMYFFLFGIHYMTSSLIITSQESH